MADYIGNPRRVILRKVLTIVFILSFVVTSVVPPRFGHAQLIPETVFNLPVPGTMVSISRPFMPAVIKGLTIHPENPLRFDFIVDTGDSGLTGEAMAEEGQKLIKYFLATLTVPEQELWVNLSPYENGRIISESFGQTEMGRDLLAQDYMLKQLSASLMYPEEGLGKTFWSRVYTKAHEQFGTTEIPMNTFNKIWIIPERALVYEKDNQAFIIHSHLKVMLEEDYVALQKNMGNTAFDMDRLDTSDTEIVSSVSSRIVNEVLIPEIEREINEGGTFANLRQIYQSVILATWYKINLKESLLGQVYVNQNKIKGVDLKDTSVNEKIYDQYLVSFKKGVFNYIREDVDPVTRATIPRKYFSGGSSAEMVQVNVKVPLEGGRVSEMVSPSLQSSPVSLGEMRELLRAVMNGVGAKYLAMTTDLTEMGIKNRPGAVAQVMERAVRMRASSPVEQDEALASSPVTAEVVVKPSILGEVAYPQPPVRVDANGRIYPFWKMLRGVLEILMERSDRGEKKPFDLSNRNKRMLADEFEKRYGFSNLNGTSGISITEMFDYLFDLGFLGKQGGGYLLVESRREDMYVWARTNVVLERALEKLFNEQGVLNTVELNRVVKNYDDAAARNRLSLVEPYQTFLRAVLNIEPGHRQEIVNYLKGKYFEGEQAPYTGGVLVDSLLLMLRKIDDLPRWARQTLPQLTREGREIHLVAPEITLLAGGLGRVMQYLGRALKHMGMEVVFIEPGYDKKIIYNQKANREEEIPLDYSALPIPLTIPQTPEFSFSITVQQKPVTVNVHRAVNDEEIPVYIFKDATRFYTRVLYRHGDGVKYPTQGGLVEFVSKASLRVSEMLASNKKSEMESQGKVWAPPLFASNDGQSLMANALHIYDKDFQSDVSFLIHRAGTNHTVLNTIRMMEYESDGAGGPVGALTKAGVPQEYFWLFKRLQGWWAEGMSGQVHDASKGGITGTLLSHGFTNSVSEGHGDVMREWLTDVFGDLVGLTNGDLISLTMRPFGREFVGLYGTADQKGRLQNLDAELNNAEQAEKAVVQRKIDNFFQDVIWGWADAPGRTRDQKKVMLQDVKTALKLQYIERYIKPKQSELGIKIPKDYSGEEAFWKAFADRPWVGTSLRWVWEKWGLKRAFAKENIEKLINEHNLVVNILGNPQYYEGTNSSGQSLYEANAQIELAKQLNGGDNLAKYVFQKGFDLNEQLLFLMAADTIIMDSETIKLENSFLPTGASESTETHGLSLIVGPAERHGFIQDIATGINWADGRGTNPVPENASPEAYAEIYKQIAASKDEGALYNHMVDAFDQFRAVDVILTAFGYARGWDRSIRETEVWRRQLAGENGLSEPEALGQYYRGLARPEGEVRILDVTGVEDSRIVVKRYGPDASPTGEAVMHLSPSHLAVRKLTLQVAVDPQGVPVEQVQAQLVDSQSRIQTGLRQSVDKGKIIFEADIDISNISGLVGEHFTFRASGGSWFEKKDIFIRSSLNDATRNRIASQADRKFGRKILNGHRAEGNKVFIQQGGRLKLEVAVPLLDHQWLGHLKLGVYTNMRDGNWRFLNPDEYEVVGKPTLEDGRLRWTLRLEPALSGDITFALFEDIDSFDVTKAIAWEHGPDEKNLSVEMRATGRDAFSFGSGPAASSSPVENQETVEKLEDMSLGPPVAGGTSMEESPDAAVLRRDGDHAMLTEEIDLDQLNALIPKQGYAGAYLFLGHGSKGQFKDVSEMEKVMEEMIQELDGKHGKGKWLLVFGGDPANAEKPDIGYFVKRLKEKHPEIPLLAIQADEYKKYGVGDYVDFVYYYPTQRGEAGNILYGGYDESSGALFGSSRFYLGEKFLQSGLKGIVSFGGGDIAKGVVNYGLKLGLNVTAYKIEARYPSAAGEAYGSLEAWLDSQPNRNNLQRRNVVAVPVEEESPDAVVRTQGKPDKIGGIDLNPGMLDLQIKRDGNGIPLPINMQPIETMHIEGFIPIIIQIVPTSVPLLLGGSEAETDGSTEALDLGYRTLPAVLGSKNRLKVGRELSLLH
jgi:hypothetical protein